MGSYGNTVFPHHIELNIEFEVDGLQQGDIHAYIPIGHDISPTFPYL